MTYHDVKANRREVLVSVAERGTAPRSRWPLRPRRSATA